MQEKISSDSKTFLISEMPWLTEPTKKDLIEIDLSGSTIIFLSNVGILFLKMRLKLFKDIN